MASRPETDTGGGSNWFVRGLLLILVIVLLVPVIAAAAVVITSRSDQRTKSDAIVVLGTTQFDGRPQPTFEARLQHAKDLFDDGVAPRIITVGGKAKGDRFSEAAAGKAWLVDNGVPASKVVADGTGDDTFTSLEAAARTMKDKSWCSAVLVSDPWHMLRTRTMARDLGIDASTSPTRSGPTRGIGAGIRYTARESAALLYYLTTMGRTVEPVVTGCN